jgi:hypothetical protein
VEVILAQTKQNCATMPAPKEGEVGARVLILGFHIVLAKTLQSKKLFALNPVTFTVTV